MADVPSDPVLIAVAHGSRRPAAQADVRTLLAGLRAARPGLVVREAYIELAGPTLPAVLSSEARPAVVVPLLLGSGYHVAHDVAGVAAAYRDVPCAPALGPDPSLAEALADRLLAAEGPEPSDAPVVLAAAGSSDPRSHADTEAMAGMLAMRLGRPVVPAYNSAARPSVRDTVAALRRRRYRRISVAGYLLWPGRFAAEVTACGADVVSGPIGLHPALIRLVLNRYDAARVATESPRVA
jgi:sirohydrochlorin ferrochelatase